MRAIHVVPFGAVAPPLPLDRAPPADAITRFNIAPTQPVLVIANERPDRFDYFNCGLIPPWAKDPSVGNRMINARVETVAEKPAYSKRLRRPPLSRPG